jgi:sugar lactone lactonase YvrE
MTVQILDHTQCELGEGPTYDPVQDKAWWFDIVGRRLYEHDFDAGRTDVHELPVMASMLGVVDAATQLVATEDGLYLRDAATNRLTLHHPLESDNPATRSNDGRVHPSGAIWIGTMGKDAEPGAGAIYWFFKGELRRLYPEISIPNSICFSPDAATAYFTDSRTGRLMTVRVDPGDGYPIGEASVLYDYGIQKSGLDGAVTDADGTIWIACWGAARLIAVSPKGERLHSVPLPASQVTCPAFIGRNLARLLVTSAWQNLKDEERAADEHAGKTFVVDMPVRGKAEPRVIL